MAVYSFFEAARIALAFPHPLYTGSWRSRSLAENLHARSTLGFKSTSRRASLFNG